MTEKTLEYYLRLPYTVEIESTEDGYFARIVELPGCMIWAETPKEIEPMIKDAMICWIEGSLEADLPIPEPGQ
jgi:predicted RNase H-like HicB family nuclease